MAKELPRIRLATMDETGKRVYLYPASTTGRFTSLKKYVHGAMLLFFLLLPWIQVNGRQLLLFDVAHREFFFFGLHFRSHDAPLVLLLLLSFTFTIGFVTSVWGRIWCGWACPQTVFTESIFRRLESWIEGSHLERRNLDLGPLNLEKICKKTVKWSAFLAVSLLITHSFLAYFVGSRELISMISSPPTENWPSFLVILFTTAIILFDFGWFREQFCVIMCPYGRFQSVMLDSGSMVVGYDAKRGEPRRGAVAAGQSQGDCVDCLRCVTVCPTGIDIRRGLQMECIACTACIDACDRVMEKVNKPLGLIRYTSLAELSGSKRNIFSVRSAIYAALALITIGTLAITLGRKDFLEATVLRAQGAPYELLPSPAGPNVLNHFRLDISNQTGSTESLLLALSPEDQKKGVVLIMPLNSLSLPDGVSQKSDFFLRFPSEILSGGTYVVTLELRTKSAPRKLEVTIVGPGV